MTEAARHTVEEAVAGQARAAVADDPQNDDLMKALAVAVRAAASASSSEPVADNRAAEVVQAQALLDAGEQEEAEILIRARLKTAPRDLAAMNILADIATRSGFADKALLILQRATVFAPSDAETWANLGRLWQRLNRFGDALATLRRSLDLRPNDEATLSFLAGVLVQMRRLEDAVPIFERLVMHHPHSARVWMNYGYVLKTIGRTGEAVAAYRTALTLDPRSGAAWWGYANMKTARFIPDDLGVMADALARELSDTDRTDLHFGYSRALEQFNDIDGAARQLELGNSLRKRMHPYDADKVTGDVDRQIALFTPTFFAARESWGSDRADPIFIIGMHRSGSTLVEQVLASHSQVEGTEELPILQRIADELAEEAGGESFYPDLLADLDGERLHALGGRYLEEARHYRRTSKPFFTDKMPGNWAHIGLIRLMLPKAQILDVRRDPRDCCFANYAQHFLWGVNATYDQVDVARFYSDYVRALRHIDIVLPTLVHHVIYEDLIADLRGEIVALLQYLQLPFEQSCLEFFRTERSVYTPSAQQVRKPINADGVGRWRRYETHLRPLIAALGELPVTYRS